ncbi:helix-turn-helix domain-containing protein [Streptomyces sp. NPDC127079]|uniref:helix-turn-helix domain-containing protein n=1 Tax=Streptomyces sp. NPDC127079 TaxID=3347132 RepID=UPI0036619C3B
MASLNVGNLGEYLREQRRNAQLSLRQLADAAGVSNPYLSQIERGLRKPSAEVLQQVAKALRISAEYAVKARETYEKVAEHGEQAVKTWRGEAAEEIEDLAIVVEGKPEPVETRQEPKKADEPKAAEAKPVAVKKAPAAPKKVQAPAPRKATPTAKKTTPPAK